MSNPQDRQILNSLVNPLLPLGEAVYDDEKEIPDDLRDNEQDTEDVKKSIDLEKEAIAACESGEMSKALNLFQAAIQAAPSRPACYNNRAQAYRLMGKEDEAMADLNKVIEMTQGAKCRSSCQAYCQRGLLHRKNGRDDEAISDFKKSASMGNEYAKSLLVQLNPYAAMCNKMLQSMFKALEEGKEEVENPFKNVGHKQTQG